MILWIALQMLGKFCDALGQNRNLNISRASIFLVELEFLGYFFFCTFI